MRYTQPTDTSARPDGADGLHDVHDAFPHLGPSESWKSLFHGDSADPDTTSPYFTASRTPSHKEILRILKEEPEDTVSILAVGPLTNMAMAAAEDPETFLRVKELVVMGGSVLVPGNATPVAEFNCYADAVASARVYALTSPNPQSTMPLIPAHISQLAPYPEKLSKRLNLILCPLDITTPHEISRSFFTEQIKPLVDAGSPLAQWTAHFVNGAFAKIESMIKEGNEAALSLHDPLTVWYVLTGDDPMWRFPAKPEDIRVETSGQWTLGMHIIDARDRSKPGETSAELFEDPGKSDKFTTLDQVPGDTMGWLSVSKGNRIHRVIGSPGADIFKEFLMHRIFG